MECTNIKSRIYDTVRLKEKMTKAVIKSRQGSIPIDLTRPHFGEAPLPHEPHLHQCHENMELMMVINHGFNHILTSYKQQKNLFNLWLYNV